MILLFLAISTCATLMSEYEIASVSFQGSRPYQQDRCYSTSCKDDAVIAAIFDGHGEYGHEIAEMAKNVAPHILNEINLTDESIKQAFRKINNHIYQKIGKIKTAESGTTALVLLQNNQEYIIAHCGDSRAVWGSEHHQQTQDHSGRNKNEIARVGKQNIKNKYGVERLGGVLAVTRSLGDVSLKALGLSATPDITRIAKTDVTHIILGCDGVFDFTSVKKSSQSTQADDDSILWTLVDYEGQRRSCPSDQLVLKLGVAVMTSEPEPDPHTAEQMYQYAVGKVGLVKRKNLTAKQKLKVIRESLGDPHYKWHFNVLKGFVQNYASVLHDNTTLVLFRHNPREIAKREDPVRWFLRYFQEH